MLMFKNQSCTSKLIVLICTYGHCSICNKVMAFEFYSIMEYGGYKSRMSLPYSPTYLIYTYLLPLLYHTSNISDLDTILLSCTCLIICYIMSNLKLDLSRTRSMCPFPGHQLEICRRHQTMLFLFFI